MERNFDNCIEILQSLLFMTVAAVAWLPTGHRLSSDIQIFYKIKTLLCAARKKIRRRLK